MICFRRRPRRDEVHKSLDGKFLTRMFSARFVLTGRISGQTFVLTGLFPVRFVLARFFQPYLFPARFWTDLFWLVFSGRILSGQEFWPGVLFLERGGEGRKIPPLISSFIFESCFGPSCTFKNDRDGRGSVLTKFQPVISYGGPTSSRFYVCLST